VDAVVGLGEVAVGSILSSAEVAASTGVSAGADIVAVGNPWMIAFASTTAAAVAEAQTLPPSVHFVMIQTVVNLML
jgi:hypothetical protein